MTQQSLFEYPWIPLMHWSWFRISIYLPFPGKIGLHSYLNQLNPAILFDVWSAFKEPWSRSFLFSLIYSVTYEERGSARICQLSEAYSFNRGREVKNRQCWRYKCESRCRQQKCLDVTNLSFKVFGPDQHRHWHPVGKGIDRIVCVIFLWHSPVSP